jgi:hypothetical protein
MTASLPADDRRPIATVAIIGNDALLIAAPATPVQFAHACLRRGFTVAVPVTWGDELLAAEAVRQLSSRARGPAVMCVCPFVRARLLAPGPDLAPFLVSLVSPPVATARYLRTVYGDRGVHITYIGACPGADDHAIDARLTPDAFLGELAEHGISLAEQPLVFDSIVPPDRRRWCSLPGGVPSAEVLWSDTDTRTLVEIERDDVSTDLAQHIIARDHVLLDLAPSLGCACSGAIPSLTPRSARVAVTALEPPRALGPVIEPPTPIALDLPVFGATRAAELPKSVEPSPLVAERTQREIDHEARERALDMILGGDPEPPAATPPPRRHTSSRADVRQPEPPPAPRPVEMTVVEPVVARAERRMASTMSSLVLETLIDEILIEPLIIPETKPAPADVPPPAVAEPVDRATARSAAEVPVEIGIAREAVAEAPVAGVRPENGSSPALTSPPDSMDGDGVGGGMAVEADRARLESVKLPDPSDVEVSTNDSKLAAAPMSTAPVGATPPFEDDDLVADANESVDDDGVASSSTDVRRRTPPAMPARHPPSTIPKAVAADGRPLPRAYVAKRRVTPPGNMAIRSEPPVVAPEPEPVERATDSPPPEPTAETATVAKIEMPAAEPVAATVPPILVERLESPALVRQDDPAAAPPPEPEEETPSTSESVWGVTLEAPVVTAPTTTDASPRAESPQLAAVPAERLAEMAVGTRPGASVAPTANRNTLVTIMVVALVTLAVAAFVLLGR